MCFVCVCDKMDPRRLKKDMLKSLKLIKGEDRVLIMGTSKSPLLADIKSLGKMFSKIILIPRPDYGSRCSKIRDPSNTFFYQCQYHNIVVVVKHDARLWFQFCGRR